MVVGGKAIYSVLRKDAVNLKDNTVGKDDEEKFYKALFLLLGLNVAHCILQYFSTLLGAYLSNKMVRKLRNDLFLFSLGMYVGTLRFFEYIP